MPDFIYFNKSKVITILLAIAIISSISVFVYKQYFPQSNTTLKLPAVGPALSDKIVVSAAISVSESVISANDVFLVSFDGKTVNNLTISKDTKIAGGGINPTLSPDRTRIAYVSASINEKQSQIFIMDTSGKEKDQVTFSPGSKYTPSWSPDGKKLLYILATGGKNYIYQMDLATGIETKLEKDAFDVASPVWLPDGTGYSYLAIGDSGSRKLMIYQNGKDSEIPLTVGGNRKYDIVNPVFSPDGKKVAFIRASDNEQLYLMDRDGSGVVKLSNSTNSHFSTPSWSRDGNSLFVAENDTKVKKFYIAQIDTTGKNILRLNVSYLVNLNMPKVAGY